MKTLVFATNNKHKLDEVSHILAHFVRIVSLSDIDCHDDIPETSETLEGNALQKARFIKDRYGRDCFADDTGLEVASLNNAPGVYSARYAGPDHDSEKNMDKLLKALEGKTDRKARFRTVVALILNGEEHLFEGIIKGRIITKRRGEAGFGYDPIFVPDGCSETFAEMGNDEKNQISHRAIAMNKLAEFLSTIKD
jgi:XTP/dITP diphosphohydrolase